MNDGGVEGYVNVLWSGGWDSTFRMIQLARSGREVQPYYIIDTNRPSTLVELERMQVIRENLSRRYEDCTIREIRCLTLDLVSFDDESAALDRLRKEHSIGSQYMWISAFSKKIAGLELCIHKDDRAECFVNRIATPAGRATDADINLLFGNLRFPLIGYTKLEMKQEVDSNGDLGILNKSWFCHTPINGKPCGICNPCKDCVKEGLKDRLPRQARIYRQIPVAVKAARRIARKLV